MPNRERYFGDQLICNFGSAARVGTAHTLADIRGWHTDNDWCHPPPPACTPRGR
jgi:hypothetical protein